MNQENLVAFVEALKHLFLADRDEVSTVYLIRHGACEDFTQSNNYDPPLTAEGIAQANSVARRLVDIGVERLISSPALRAKQTADIIGQYLRVPPQTVDDFEEIRFGNDITTFVAGLKETMHASVSRCQMNNRLLQLSLRYSRSCETGKALRSRAVAAVNSVIDAYPKEKIAIITHGLFINAYLAELLGLTGDVFFFPFETSLTVVKAHNKRRILVQINDTCHLLNRHLELE